LCAPPPIAHAGTLVRQESSAQESGKQETWQQEFDAVCSKTTDAMSLSIDELKSLIQRCDTLEPKIEKLDDTRRKVYLRRLKQWRSSSCCPTSSGRFSIISSRLRICGASMRAMLQAARRTTSFSISSGRSPTSSPCPSGSRDSTICYGGPKASATE